MLKGEPKLDVNLRGGRAHASTVQSAAYYGGYKIELLAEGGCGLEYRQSGSTDGIIFLKGKCL